MATSSPPSASPPSASPPTTGVPTTVRRPRVLFVGDDASSPQIAASLLRRLTADQVSVATAGTQLADPGGRPDEMLVAMGLNPADEVRLSAGALRTADRVVILGTSLDVARLAGPRYEEWDVVNDDLATLVQALGDELVGVPAAPVPTSVRQRLLALLADRHRRGTPHRRP